MDRWARPLACLVGLALALAPGAARAQWGSIHPGTTHAPPPPPPATPTPRPEATPTLHPAPAPGGLHLVPGLVAGWWGLGRTEGSGYDGSLALGLRIEAEPLPWLPVEVLAIYGGRRGGTPVVHSQSTYVSLVALAGWQYVHGLGVYGVEAGVAGTYHHVTHTVTDGAGQVVGAGGVSLGPAWTLDMGLRLGPVEARVDVGSVWRGGQADLLVLAGVGLRLPLPGGE